MFAAPVLLRVSPEVEGLQERTQDAEEGGKEDHCGLCHQIAGEGGPAKRGRGYETFVVVIVAVAC